MVKFKNYIDRVNETSFMEDNAFKSTSQEGNTIVYTDRAGVSVVLMEEGMNIFFNTVYTTNASLYQKGTQHTYMSAVFLSLGALLKSLPGLVEKDMTTILNLVISRVTDSVTASPIRWKGYEVLVRPTRGLMMVMVKKVDTDSDFWYNSSTEEE